MQEYVLKHAQLIISSVKEGLHTQKYVTACTGGFCMIIYTCMIDYTLHIHTMIAHIYLHRCRCNTGLSQSSLGVVVLHVFFQLGKKTLGDLSTIGCTAEGMVVCKLVFTLCHILNNLNDFLLHYTEENVGSFSGCCNDFSASHMQSGN